MIEVLIALVSFMILLVLFQFFLTVRRNPPDPTPNLLNLQDKIEDIKTQQLQHQQQWLTQQQNVLLQTQKELREQLDLVQKTVQTNLQSTQGQLNMRLQESNQVIGQIQQKLGSLEATTKNIQEISKDIASLQDLLRAPKIRGNIGEFLLEQLLRDVLPENQWKLQHQFSNRATVDAVIYLGEKLVPIDSKFPMESFHRMIQTQSAPQEEHDKAKREFFRSLKTKIDDIAEKYIRSDEGTFDFALMYIPAEKVFYELISLQIAGDPESIFNYAIRKHVIPVSPGTFYAYLMAIVLGLRGLKVEKRAMEILEHLSQLERNFLSFIGDYRILGNHLNNARSKFDESFKKAEGIQNQLSGLVKSDSPNEVKSLQEQ